MSFEQSITAKKNFMQVDYTLIKKLGADRAVFLTHLIKKHDAHNPDDGWFYATYAGIEAKLGLAVAKQQAIVKSLKKLGLIKTQMRTDDVGTKQYFFICIGEVKNLLVGSDSPQKSIGTPPKNYEGLPPKITRDSPQKMRGTPPKNYEGLPPKNEGVNYSLKRESKTIPESESLKDTSLKADGGEPPATDNFREISKPAIARDLIQSVIEKILEDDEPETHPGGQVKTPLIEIEENTHPINEVKTPSTEVEDNLSPIREAIDFSKTIRTDKPAQPPEGEAPAEQYESRQSFYDRLAAQFEETPDQDFGEASAERMSDDSCSAPIGTIPLNDEDFDMMSLIKGAFKTMPNEA